jgi:serpin B
MKKLVVLLGIVAILTASGCIHGGGLADDSGATPEGISAHVNANNQFALDFYSNIRNKEDGNIFYSPYSISTALSMTYEGARGQTADEIQSVFHFSSIDSERRSSTAAIYNSLNKWNARYKLHTANALWVQEDYPISDEYTDTIERYYVGKASNVDFAGATEQARQTINSWVEQKTNYKIKDLFPQGSLGSLTRLVLTNAIYFKGTWVKQFDEAKTMDEDFRVSSGQTVRVPMMRLTGNEAVFNYSETGELQVLEMPYEGGDLSMIILLPKDDNIESLEESLTLENLNQWKASLREQRVDVYIPKFTFESKYFLNENLKEMGMPLAFTEAADFSGISGERDLYIAIVVHQAFVDVNEEGTEAAAATGVGIATTSMPPPAPVFRADHPFIFMIQERGTGNILFMGRVVNPS